LDLRSWTSTKNLPALRGLLITVAIRASSPGLLEAAEVRVAPSSAFRIRRSEASRGGLTVMLRRAFASISSRLRA
jgi:hypothetical protein